MSVELVDYDAYVKLSPEERMMQRLQALGEVLAVSGAKPVAPEEDTVVDGDEIVTSVVPRDDVLVTGSDMPLSVRPKKPMKR